MRWKMQNKRIFFFFLIFVLENLNWDSLLYNSPADACHWKQASFASVGTTITYLANLTAEKGWSWCINNVAGDIVAVGRPVWSSDYRVTEK